MGTRINPPPAPMRVPNAPINIPNGKSHKYSTGMSRLIFSFQLKFRETRLRTHICQSKRTRGIEEFLAAARRRQTITLFPKTTRPSEKEGNKGVPGAREPKSLLEVLLFNRNSFSPRARYKIVPRCDNAPRLCLLW